MRVQRPKTLTLQRLEPEDTIRAGDISLNEVYNADALTVDDITETFYRVANPIPEGYEVCDLKDATKVLIGETWFEKVGIIIQRAGSPHYFTEEALAPLGVLAIRPAPEPEPMSGEVDVIGGLSRGKCAGIAAFPPHIIGNRIRWEAVKDGDES